MIPDFDNKSLKEITGEISQWLAVLLFMAFITIVILLGLAAFLNTALSDGQNVCIIWNKSPNMI